MDLQYLKWTKNLRRHDGAWAYREYKVSDSFKLAWKDDEVNANKPEKSSLMLLPSPRKGQGLGVRVINHP